MLALHLELNVTVESSAQISLTSELAGDMQWQIVDEENK